MNDFERNDLKIATWDIETLDLSAEWAYVVCASVKECNPKNLSGRIYTFRIDDYDYKKDQDKGLVKDLINCLNTFDLTAGWFSSRFDTPFINTRALKHGLMPPLKKFRRDLCLCARGFGKLNSNRLANWDRWLFGKATKTSLTLSAKLGAIRGEKWAIDYYVDHCEKDVFSTERIYKKFANANLLGKLRKGG